MLLLASARPSSVQTLLQSLRRQQPRSRSRSPVAHTPLFLKQANLREWQRRSPRLLLPRDARESLGETENLGKISLSLRPSTAPRSRIYRLAPPILPIPAKVPI